MTKNEMIKKVVSLAESELGYVEPNHDNHNKYAAWIDSTYPPTEWYNGKKDGGDWCTIFVDYCFLYALGYDIAYKILNRSCSCGKYAAVVHYMYECLLAQGRVGKEPHVGDIVFYHNDKYSGLEQLSHVGIVVGIEGSYIYTVEGNSGSNNDRVYKRKIRKDYDTTKWGIYGYGYPGYYDVEPDPHDYDGYTVGCRYMVICRDTLNVRTKAEVSDSALIVTELEPGTQFICDGLIHDNEGNIWMRIHEPASGWIAAKYRGEKYVGDGIEPKTIDGYSVGEDYQVVAKKGLNVRKGPSKNYSVIKSVSYGTNIRCYDVISVDGDVWVRISNKEEMWVAARYKGDRYLK